jgi:hypothetical protein
MAWGILLHNFPKSIPIPSQLLRHGFPCLPKLSGSYNKDKIKCIGSLGKGAVSTS